MIDLFKGAFKGFGKDECGMRAAALSYYTVFALPPLLILLVTIAGKMWNPVEVQRGLEGQFAKVIGQAGAQEIHVMIERGTVAGSGLVASIVGASGLLLGAVGAFLSLQDALNHAWEVKPDPRQGGVRNFITKRLLSLGMVLGLGFLIAVSLALSAAIASFANTITGEKATAVLYVADVLTSLVVLTTVFAALFKFLPDAEVLWSDVWLGGLVTSILFTGGKFVLGLYLGRSRPGDAFGAASALAVILVWIYYAGIILLFGAELTREWAALRGKRPRPSEGAERVVQREVRVNERTKARP